MGRADALTGLSEKSSQRPREWVLSPGTAQRTRSAGRGDERKALSSGAGKTEDGQRVTRSSGVAARGAHRLSNHNKPRDSTERDEKPLLGLSSEPSTDLQHTRLETG